MDDFQDLLSLTKTANGVPVFRDGWVALADQNVVVVAEQWRVNETILLSHSSVPLIPPDWLTWLVDGKPATQDKIPPALVQNMWQKIYAAARRMMIL